MIQEPPATSWRFSLRALMASVAIFALGIVTGYLFKSPIERVVTIIRPPTVAKPKPTPHQIKIEGPAGTPFTLTLVNRPAPGEFFKLFSYNGKLPFTYAFEGVGTIAWVDFPPRSKRGPIEKAKTSLFENGAPRNTAEALLFPGLPAQSVVVNNFR